VSAGPATLIRITGTWEFAVDEVVAEQGHKDCKGWLLTGDGEMVFCRCGKLSFPLAQVVSR